MADLREESLKVYPNALAEVGLKEVRERAPWPEEAGEKKAKCGPEAVRFQAMRTGYFCVDKDTDDAGGKIVLNRIVSLKEDAGKSCMMVLGKY